MLEFVLNTFIVLFIVIDPVGLAPIFAAMTHGGGPDYQRRMAIKGVVLGTLIIIVFSLSGRFLFHALGISLDAFRIAGGVLLFLLSMDMIFARQSGIRSTTTSELEEAEHRQDISVFPLAIPLIAGPGAFTTMLLMLGDAQGDWGQTTIIFAVLLTILGLTLMALLSTARIMSLIGQTGTNVISRVLGIILASLAVQYIIDGVRASLIEPLLN